MCSYLGYAGLCWSGGCFEYKYAVFFLGICLDVILTRLAANCRFGQNLFVRDIIGLLTSDPVDQLLFQPNISQILIDLTIYLYSYPFLVTVHLRKSSTKKLYHLPRYGGDLRTVRGRWCPDDLVLLPVKYQERYGVD